MDEKDEDDSGYEDEEQLVFVMPMLKKEDSISRASFPMGEQMDTRSRSNSGLNDNLFEMAGDYIHRGSITKVQRQQDEIQEEAS